jgi:two-component system OmpR family sensor kinase
MYILSLTPAGAGILISWMTLNQWIPNPVIYLRANTAPLSLFSGILLSIGLLAAFYLRGKVMENHQRKTLELEKQSVEDRRRFLSRLDHELKNPLTAIQAGLSNLSSAVLEPDHVDEVNAVKTQVLRISRLVSDLRKLSAFESTPLEKVNVNIADILKDVVDYFGNTASSEKRKLKLILPNAPRPLPNVDGDPDLLLLAFHNLVDNAMKFTEPGDTIEVRATENGKEVIIEVADTGPGIPQEEVELVWEELYRSENARSIAGSGLGLALVQVIIQNHGGKVGLRSILDQGSVFSIYLPSNDRVG